MKTFENEALGVSFSLPDKLTVRQQLAFRQRLAASDGDLYSRYFMASVPLIEDWQCELVPVVADVDLDTETRTSVADIVQWMANEVAIYFTDLGTVPKKK